MKLAGMPGGGLRRIAHFGSTAVPGMRAKPIIDIMASVEALMEVDALFSPLGVLGYEPVDVGFAKRRFFHKAPASHSIACHLHVVTDAVWRDKSELLFRDWLITHPSVARAYERLKEKLADEHPSDMPAYTAGKSELVRAAVNDARRERGLPPSIDWIE